MRKEDVISVLTEDESNGNGEILEVTDDYVSYCDYTDDTTKEFRFDKSCTDEYMSTIIKIGESAKSNGLTEKFIVSVLKKAFGEDYFDAVCTLSGIIVPSNKNEFIKMLKDTIRTGDDIDEWYSWEDNEHYVGKMLTQHQIVLINEPVIHKMAHEMAEDEQEENKEYEIGILTTLLHEMRHLMLDTNPFLPEEEFPEELKEEENVEEFARETYESLGELRFWR